MLGLWLGLPVTPFVAIDLVGSVDVLLVEDDGRAVGRNVAASRTAACSGVIRELVEGPSGGQDDVLRGEGVRVGVGVRIGIRIRIRIGVRI